MWFPSMAPRLEPAHRQHTSTHPKGESDSASTARREASAAALRPGCAPESTLGKGKDETRAMSAVAPSSDGRRLPLPVLSV